jgi:hypothetical protein
MKSLLVPQTIPTSSLLDCVSIASNALSKLNQKLISCEAVPLDHYVPIYFRHSLYGFDDPQVNV